MDSIIVVGFGASSVRRDVQVPSADARTVESRGGVWDIGMVGVAGTEQKQANPSRQAAEEEKEELPPPAVKSDFAIRRASPRARQMAMACISSRGDTNLGINADNDIHAALVAAGGAEAWGWR